MERASSAQIHAEHAQSKGNTLCSCARLATAAAAAPAAGVLIPCEAAHLRPVLLKPAQVFWRRQQPAHICNALLLCFKRLQVQSVCDGTWNLLPASFCG